MTWYSRPVLFVAEIDPSVEFYVCKLGFVEAWRYVEDGKALVAQVERDGCEIILSCQRPAGTGHGLLFIALDAGAIDGVRAELEGRGVEVKDAQWGYHVMVVDDPDGNELYFPYPDD